MNRTPSLLIGLGLIFVEEGLDEDLGNPEIAVSLVDIRKVPEPSTLLMFAMGLTGLGFGGFFLCRRRPLASEHFT